MDRRWFPDRFLADGSLFSVDAIIFYSEIVDIVLSRKKESFIFLRGKDQENMPIRFRWPGWIGTLPFKYGFSHYKETGPPSGSPALGGRKKRVGFVWVFWSHKLVSRIPIIETDNTT